jgi:hypothetical protein
MRADRERKRDETIRRESPLRVAAGLLFLTGLIVLSSKAESRLILIPMGFSVLFIVGEALLWLSARRRLKSHEVTRKNARPLRREDPESGALEWRSEEERWCLDHVVDGESVAVCFDGDRESGPAPSSAAMWLAIKPRLPELWAKVASHAEAWSTREGPMRLLASDLALESLVICPDDAFEGGELVFHFSAPTDLDGSYCVPMHEGEPLHVHRDT